MKLDDALDPLACAGLVGVALAFGAQTLIQGVLGGVFAARGVTLTGPAEPETS